ncbi:hypothetical protein FHG87_009737 [Trinorchestia longiramus]|nr:hypothetical protein FHG87_009737 [Trinorchestia longiramus]
MDGCRAGLSLLVLLAFSVAFSHAQDVTPITLDSMTWSAEDTSTTLTVCATENFNGTTDDIRLDVKVLDDSNQPTETPWQSESFNGTCATFANVTGLTQPMTEAKYELTAYSNGTELQQGTVTFAFPLSDGTAIDCETSKFGRFKVNDTQGDLSSSSCLFDPPFTTCYVSTEDLDVLCVPGLGSTSGNEDFKQSQHELHCSNHSTSCTAAITARAAQQQSQHELHCSNHSTSCTAAITARAALQQSQNELHCSNHSTSCTAAITVRAALHAAITAPAALQQSQHQLHCNNHSTSCIIAITIVIHTDAGYITAVSLTYNTDSSGGSFVISSEVTSETLELLRTNAGDPDSSFMAVCSAESCAFSNMPPSQNLYELCSVYVDNSNAVTNVGTFEFQDLNLKVDLVGETVDFHFDNVGYENNYIYNVYGYTDDPLLDTPSFTLDCSHIDPTSFCNGFFDDYPSPTSIGVSFESKDDNVVIAPVPSATTGSDVDEKKGIASDTANVENIVF